LWDEFSELLVSLVNSQKVRKQPWKTNLNGYPTNDKALETAGISSFKKYG